MATSTEEITASLTRTQSAPNESFRQSLMQYEMRLERQLTRAYRLLHHLQSTEASQSPPIFY